MPPSASNEPADVSIPLCVDLDGTLILSDMTLESIVRLLRRNVFYLFLLPFWLLRGRAYLKAKLVARVQVEVGELAFHEEFVAFLHAEGRSGRRIILVTASDRQMAEPIAQHLGLFSEVVASDGKTNLRGKTKAAQLVKQFGERGFDYAGNSPVDLPVWSRARSAIVVNASPKLVERARGCAKVSRVFERPATPKHPLLGTVWRAGLRPMLAGFGRRHALATGAGVLLAASFPKIGIAGLAWIAPGLILASALDKPGGEAFRLGYLAGLVHYLVSLYWLLLIPFRWHSIPLGPATGWLCLSAFLALYPATWVWLMSSGRKISGMLKLENENPALSDVLGLALGGVMSRSWSQRTFWAISGAAVWVALEMAVARLLGGFPWNLLGASQYQMVPLIQLASVTGIYGVSFVAVWVSLSLLSAGLMIMWRPKMRSAWMSEIVLPLVAVAMLYHLGFRELRDGGSKAEPGRKLKVAFVQPSIPQTLIWDERADDERFREVVKLSQAAATNGVELLIWPEAAVPKLFRYYEEMFGPITELARSNHIWMIIGADDMEPRPGATNPQDRLYFNSSFLISPDGKLIDRYCKRNLVIFGEYIPLVRWLPFLKYFTSIEGSGFTPGKEPVPFGLTGLGVETSVLICFEDVFPHLARDYVDEKTDFLVNLTNNGWFGEGAAQWQHATSALFRAVENGVPLLRCSNNGLTCWVDEHGRLQKIFHDATGSIYGAGYMMAEIPLRRAEEKREMTFYNRHGDVFGWTCVGIGLVQLVRKVLGRNEKKAGMGKA